MLSRLGLLRTVNTFLLSKDMLLSHIPIDFSLLVWLLRRDFGLQGRVEDETWQPPTSSVPFGLALEEDLLDFENQSANFPQLQLERCHREDAALSGDDRLSVLVCLCLARRHLSLVPTVGSIRLPIFLLSRHRNDASKTE